MAVQIVEAVPTIRLRVRGEAHDSIYRRGFEAALNPETFEQAYESVIPYLQEHYPHIYQDESFRRGYALGQDYTETLQER